MDFDIVVPTPEELLCRKTNVICTFYGCERRFVNEGALKLHLIKSHRQLKSTSDERLFHKGRSGYAQTVHYHCPVQLCKYSTGNQKFFPSFQQLKQHYLKVHAEKKFKCEKCNVGFGLATDLKKHGDKCGVMYTCGSCPVQYTTKEALLMHCKRIEHTYPEEYRRKLQAETGNKRRIKVKNNSAQESKKSSTDSGDPPMSVIIVTQETLSAMTKNGLSTLLPKQAISTKQLETDILINTPSGKEPAKLSKSQNMAKQDALIQTDIYGIHTLAVSSQNCSTNQLKQSFNLTPSVPSNSGENAANEKRRTLYKRQSSIKRQSRDYNPSSPRRKKSKSTTGMQTSVSFTKKKGVPTVNSTQTTGDFILQTAMNHACIPIEKKTVASQVTPQKKQVGKENELKSSEIQTFISGFKPQLVDGSSQVQHHLTESETMTDLPPSMATQTLQSFLESQHEKLSLESDVALKENSEKVLYPTIPNSHSKNRMEIKIYNEALNASVLYILPQPKDANQSSKNCNPSSHSSDEQFSAFSPKSMPLKCNSLSNNNTNNVSYESVHKYQQKESQSASTSSFCIESTSRSNRSKDKFISIANPTTDMEAQAMSASEFDQLLQSSGIFLPNELLSDHVSNSTDSEHMYKQTNQSVRSSSSSVGLASSDLNMFSIGTGMTDMNTQTPGNELNLLDHYVSTDSNTQTVHEIDFLDLVMSNMETQTLNDDDLISLGLMDSNSTVSATSISNTHNMSIGTSDFDFENLHGSFSFHLHTSDSFADSTAGNSESLSNNSSKVGVFNGCGKFSTSVGTSDCTGYLRKPNFSSPDATFTANSCTGTTNLCPSFNKTEHGHADEAEQICKVQMETQTVSADINQQYIQTETQTQVCLSDTGFEAINMETQTTFEDLEEFCETLQ